MSCDRAPAVLRMSSSSFNCSSSRVTVLGILQQERNEKRHFGTQPCSSSTATYLRTEKQDRAGAIAPLTRQRILSHEAAIVQPCSLKMEAVCMCPRAASAAPAASF